MHTESLPAHSESAVSQKHTEDHEEAAMMCIFSPNIHSEAVSLIPAFIWSVRAPLLSPGNQKHSYLFSVNHLVLFQIDILHNKILRNVFFYNELHQFIMSLFLISYYKFYFLCTGGSIFHNPHFTFPCRIMHVTIHFLNLESTSALTDHSSSMSRCAQCERAEGGVCLHCYLIIYVLWQALYLQAKSVMQLRSTDQFLWETQTI